jgi:peroxiredoxin
MMNWRIGAAVVLAAGAACGFEARAQVDQTAEKVLKDSAAAIEKMQGVTYQSKLYGVGALKDIMDGEGQVKQLRIANFAGKRQPAWMKGEVKELGKGRTPFVVSTYIETPPSGEIVDWIDDPQNTHYKRPITDRNDAQRVLSLGSQILMNEFTEPAPFSKQLKAQKMEMKPNEQVHGADCQVVMVSWENGLRSELWWIGVEDHLPHKIEMAHGQNRDLAKGTEIWDVKVLDKADTSELVLKTPPGYKEDFVAAVAAQPAKPPENPFQQNNVQIPPAPVVGLVPGTAAPDFDLKSSDGKNVSLSGLKGNVVVLTFGGSRFPKTDVVNATVADVAKANQSLKAYTLACREETDQAAIDHAKQSKTAFPTLLGADAIRNDYKVAGFPFTYVLTPDGRVSKCFQGAVTKDQLEKAVEAASKNEIAETPKASSVMNPPGTVPAPVVKHGAQPAPNATPTAKPAK